MTSQFTPKVSEILAYSREEAARLASRSVGPEHLLLGILRMKDGPVIDVFHRLNLNLPSIKTELENRVREDEIRQPIYTNELVLNEKASNILKLAVLEARIQRTTKVDEQHLLLAILHDAANNSAKQILELNNMNYEDAMAMFFAPQNTEIKNGIGLPDEEEEEYEETNASGKSGASAKSGTTATTQKKTESKTPVLDTFGTDLTQAATDGKLDPCVGREIGQSFGGARAPALRHAQDEGRTGDRRVQPSEPEPVVHQDRAREPRQRRRDTTAYLYQRPRAQ